MLSSERCDQLFINAKPAGSFGSVAARYQETFAEVFANTPALKEECFRLRYQVYCLERQFEDATSIPTALERDVYDDHSEHALLLHRATGIPVGTVRLVLGKPSMPLGSLPFQVICKDVLARDPEFLPPNSTAEVSRFAISKERGRQAFQNTSRSGVDEIDTFARSISVLGLLKLAVEMALSNGIDYLCAIMEPALLRRLGSLGIHFNPLGPLVDYRGKRQPCFAHIATLIGNAKGEAAEIRDLLPEHRHGCDAAPVIPVADRREPTPLIADTVVANFHRVNKLNSRMNATTSHIG